jgi:hypothetical protein
VLVDSGSAIQITISAFGFPYWVGLPNNNWNLAGDLVWKQGTNGSASAYNDGDPVFFNATASNFTVNVNALVQPASMTVLGDSNYTLRAAAPWQVRPA